MKVIVGSDHRGFALKEILVKTLPDMGYEVVDMGPKVFDAEDDFTDIAFAVGGSVASDCSSRGILLCGSGGGVTIAANKVRGVRCVQGFSRDEVHHNRAHDDANILALGADRMSEEDAFGLVKEFIETSYLGEERHRRRLGKIAAKEASWSK